MQACPYQEEAPANDKEQPQQLDDYPWNLKLKTSQKTNGNELLHLFQSDKRLPSCQTQTSQFFALSPSTTDIWSKKKDFQKNTTQTSFSSFDVFKPSLRFFIFRRQLKIRRTFFLCRTHHGQSILFLKKQKRNSIFFESLQLPPIIITSSVFSAGDNHDEATSPISSSSSSLEEPPPSFPFFFQKNVKWDWLNKCFTLLTDSNHSFFNDSFSPFVSAIWRKNVRSVLKLRLISRKVTVKKEIKNKQHHNCDLYSLQCQERWIQSHISLIVNTKHNTIQIWSVMLHASAKCAKSNMSSFFLWITLQKKMRKFRRCLRQFGFGPWGNNFFESGFTFRQVTANQPFFIWMLWKISFYREVYFMS